VSKYYVDTDINLGIIVYKGVNIYCITAFLIDEQQQVIVNRESSLLPQGIVVALLLVCACENQNKNLYYVCHQVSRVQYSKFSTVVKNTVKLVVTSVGQYYREKMISSVMIIDIEGIFQYQNIVIMILS